MELRKYIEAREPEEQFLAALLMGGAAIALAAIVFIGTLAALARWILP